MTTDARLVFDVRGDLLEAARDCEAAVFLRAYGNTRSQLEDEYGPYEDASVFLALVDADGEVAAAMRLLAPGGRRGLKTLHDVGQDPWNVPGTRAAAAAQLDLAATWEVATVGSLRSTAGGTTRQSGQGGQALRYSFALYHGLGIIARVNAMTAFVAVLDERVRRLLDSVGLVTHALPGTGPGLYLGSPASTPVFARVAPMLDNQRRLHPDSFSLVTQGIGLDGVTVPPDDAFVLDRARPRGAAAPAELASWAGHPEVLVAG